MSECTHTEIVRSTIALDMVRRTFTDGTETWTVIDFTKAHCIGTDLNHGEQGYLVEQIIESPQEDAIINALLDAAAGKSTKL